MPYLTCPSCGLITYVARGHGGHAECPGCSTPLRAPRRRFEREAPAQLDRRGFFEEGLLSALALARRQLEMDVALLAELVDGHAVVHALSGDAKSFGLGRGVRIAAEDTPCRRMLAGEIPNAVPDVRADPRVEHLPLARSARIGAYLGVPLPRLEGREYVLCCLAHGRRPRLGQTDVRFLRGLAEAVTATLEARAASDSVTRRAAPAP